MHEIEYRDHRSRASSAPILSTTLHRLRSEGLAQKYLAALLLAPRTRLTNGSRAATRSGDESWSGM